MFPETSDSEVEEFVNLYKAFRSNDLYELEIVTGEDIRTFYHKDNYDTTEGSVLISSCYSWETKEDTHVNNGLNLYEQLDFFVQNPNVGLLVLREKNAPINKTPDRELRKIKGRALIWNCKNGKKYIDQTYTTTNSEVHIYRRFAKENDYLCNASGDYKDITIEVPEVIKKLEVIPAYLDTLQYKKDENYITDQYQ